MLIYIQGTRSQNTRSSGANSPASLNSPVGSPYRSPSPQTVQGAENAGVIEHHIMENNGQGAWVDVSDSDEEEEDDEAEVNPDTLIEDDEEDDPDKMDKGCLAMQAIIEEERERAEAARSLEAGECFAMRVHIIY